MRWHKLSSEIEWLAALKCRATGSITLSNSHWQLAKTVSRKLWVVDISVSNNGNALATSVSYKPTHAHSYLLFFSSDHKHVKQSIPYSKFLRLCRLCSDNKDFKTKSLEIRTFFVERGYPTQLSDSTIQIAFSKSCWDTLKPLLAKMSNDKIPIVFILHLFNYKVMNVISRKFQILKNYLETSAFSLITLLSLLDAIKTFEVI